MLHHKVIEIVQLPSKRQAARLACINENLRGHPLHFLGPFSFPLRFDGSHVRSRKHDLSGLFGTEQFFNLFGQSGLDMKRGLQYTLPCILIGLKECPEYG